ncbi:hypothetical protein EW146_g7092 [Bondarzewia mesenterica]|uniref:Uncharacterized protein n=1 Tax=Bondarzewia mesenterica TaxID=1095465 RepID=A0A4S4LLS0_9AGAM|nr:hypothetical protein EW146_g7092 [Bondarzewia mesenterica]
MSSIISLYPSPTNLRSSIIKNPPDLIPSTEELEILHEELKESRLRTLERAKKAGNDLKAIEESMRRLKEKEKGKAKAVEKVKRERGFTPLATDVEEQRPSAYSQPGPSAPRFSSIPRAPTQTPSSRASLDLRKSMPYDSKTKKKKRKREEDSDNEPEIRLSRKATPPVPHALQASYSYPGSSKAAKTTGVFATPPTKPGSGPDFTVPPRSDLTVPRPPIPPPPIPGPSKPTEVQEDFSKAKQPSQVLVSTFYTSIEPWIRSIKEEDIGFLEYTGDEVEPYIMPRLGRHYTEQWEEEDIMLYGSALPSTENIRASTSYGRPSDKVPFPKWDPATLNENDLLVEERGHGPMTERLISALLPVEDSVWKGVKAAEEAMEGRHGVGVGSAAGRQVIVEDLEKRIKDSLRFHRLLETTPDFSDPVDDPIASALRHAQRELRTVVATNKARKVRLTAIAQDRLGYQEYLELRDSIDKNISTLYSKLQKKEGPKSHKKKKKSVGGAGSESNGNGTGSPTMGTWPASAGLGPDEENTLRVPEQLKQLVATRRQWVDAVGAVFEEKQRQNPGSIWGLPPRSAYDGLEEDVTVLLERHDNSVREHDVGVAGLDGKGKGKARARGNEMDIG